MVYFMFIVNNFVKLLTLWIEHEYTFCLIHFHGQDKCLECCRKASPFAGHCQAEAFHSPRSYHALRCFLQKLRKKKTTTNA